MKKSSLLFGAFVVAMLALTAAMLVATEQRVDSTRVDDPPPLRVRNPERPAMLVVGDSYTGGSLENEGAEWPLIVGSERDWAVVRDAVGGTGYLNGGPDGGQTFISRVERTTAIYTPDVVLLAGGINDVSLGDPEQIAKAAQQELRQLREGFPAAELVMLSNFVNGRPDDSALAVRDALRGVAQAERVPFIDVTKFLTPGNVGSDGIHPTDAGHSELAEKIGAELDDLRIPEAVAVPEYLSVDQSS